MGITGTRMFSFQQTFWGKRYIANTYQSINGYGYVADLGLVADYKFNDWIEGDLSFMNGKGYSSIQKDKTLKTSAGLTITPAKHLYIRAYSDLMKYAGVWQNTLVGFIGFKNDYFYLGAEVSFKSNLDLKEGDNAWGISSTGGVSLTKKTEFCIRYDYSTSAIPEDDVIQWNYKKDGQFLVGGIQYTINNMMKVALDSQSFFPYDINALPAEYILVNVLVTFRN
jgi:hypothetical protein